MDYQGLREQGTHFEQLLSKRQPEIGERSGDIPRILSEYAASSSETTRIANAGPLDTSAVSPDDVQNAVADTSMFVTDFGNDKLSPLELWNRALDKHMALERCEQIYEQAAARGDDADTGMIGIAAPDDALAIHDDGAAPAIWVPELKLFEDFSVQITFLFLDF